MSSKKTNRALDVENFMKISTLEDVIVTYTYAKTGKEIDLGADVSVSVIEAIGEVEEWVNENEPDADYPEEDN